MATSSTKKPFSYCPGGINFSELKTKSPSMARRLEKHQEHMNTPSQATQQLLPSAPSPVNQQMVNHLFEFCFCLFVFHSNFSSPRYHPPNDPLTQAACQTRKEENQQREPAGNQQWGGNGVSATSSPPPATPKLHHNFLRLPQTTR